MRILFDHQIFLQEYGGISRYIRSLSTSMIENGLCDVEFSAYLHKCRYFSDLSQGCYLPGFGVSALDRFCQRGKVNWLLNAINERKTLRVLEHKKIDVMHATDHNVDYLASSRRKVPLVLTVHDLIPELYPECFPDIQTRLAVRKRSIEQANHIICISDSTMKDLLKIYSVPESKVTMIHHGDPEYLKPGRENQALIPLRGRYLLYVGDRKNSYKNFWPMMDALDDFMQNHDVHLVCTGSRFSPKELQRVGRFSWNTRVHATPLSDAELFAAYANAMCLLLPSLYEGFGFPLLEAMKAGCSILSSNGSCLPEIAREGALYFNPIDFSGFAVALQSVIEKNDEYQDAKKMQLDVLSNYSWKITAQLTASVYRDLQELR